jgi:hypothetical protein
VQLDGDRGPIWLFHVKRRHVICDMMIGQGRGALATSVDKATARSQPCMGCSISLMTVR